MIDINNYRVALNNLPSGIEEAEFNIESNLSKMIKVSNKEIKDNSYSNLTEIFVRAGGEKTGFSYSQDISEDPISIINRANKNSLDIDDSNKNILNKMVSDKEVNIPSSKEFDTSIDEMLQYAIKLEDKLLKQDVTIEEVMVEARVDDRTSIVINSYGLDKSFNNQVYYLSAHVIAKKDGETYNANFALSDKCFSDINLEEFAYQIMNQLGSKIGYGSFKTGKYKVVLDKSVMVNIMMTAWQVFSGIKYIEGSSSFAGRLENLIASEAFTVIDVPTYKNTGYEYSFDCEGTDALANILVDKGVLKSLLHNLKSADSLNHSPKGNAGRYALLSGTIPTDIIVTPRILLVEAGIKDRDDLLKSLNNGVYITESYDVFHSINIASGNFSIPCRGTIIKDGKKEENITELTISGNLEDLFKNILEVASDLYIEEFLMKSYCIGSPSILVKELQINVK